LNNIQLAHSRTTIAQKAEGETRIKEYTLCVSQMPVNGEPNLHFDSIEDTIEAYRNGAFIVVLDSTDRENEGDLIVAAQDVTTEKIAFMIRHTRSLSSTTCTKTLADFP